MADGTSGRATFGGEPPKSGLHHADAMIIVLEHAVAKAHDLPLGRERPGEPTRRCLCPLPGR